MPVCQQGIFFRSSHFWHPCLLIGNNFSYVYVSLCVFLFFRQPVETLSIHASLYNIYAKLHLCHVLHFMHVMVK